MARRVLAGPRSLLGAGSWRARRSRSSSSRASLIGAFTRDERVIALGVTLLAVAAMFQLFDGIQGVATGDPARTGRHADADGCGISCGHWLVGLPRGYALCFVAGYGVVGLWWGLTIGLTICGVALLVVWSRRIHAFELKTTWSG